jgi:hypothetical protein
MTAHCHHAEGSREGQTALGAGAAPQLALCWVPLPVMTHGRQMCTLVHTKSFHILSRFCHATPSLRVLICVYKTVTHTFTFSYRLKDDMEVVPFLLTQEGYEI